MAEFLNKKRKLASMPQQQKVCQTVTTMPEDFTEEESLREDGSLWRQAKWKKGNKKKEAHDKRLKGISACYTTDCDVPKSQDISFNNPKKDQCKICENFRKGDSEEFFCMYEEHNKEKEAVRRKKIMQKNNESNVEVAVFDLLQIIYLPKTNDNYIISYFIREDGQILILQSFNLNQRLTIAIFGRRNRLIEEHRKLQHA